MLSSGAGSDADSVVSAAAAGVFVGLVVLVGSLGLVGSLVSPAAAAAARAPASVSSAAAASSVAALAGAAPDGLCSWLAISTRRAAALSRLMRAAILALCPLESWFSRIGLPPPIAFRAANQLAVF